MERATRSVVCLAMVVATLLPLQASALKLPAYIKACKADDPNLNQCALTNGRAAIPHFINGDRKYKIPPLNPLTIYDFRVSQGTKSVGMDIYMREASVHGLPKMHFDASRVDLKRRHIEWDFTAKNVQIIGEYNVTGRVLVLPILGQGPANITMRDCTFNYTFDYNLERRADGKEYMVLHNDRLTFDTRRVFIRLDNLFRGDKLLVSASGPVSTMAPTPSPGQLSDWLQSNSTDMTGAISGMVADLSENMNRFLNENWKEVTQEVGPTIADAISEVFRRILSQISDIVPWEYVFPSS